MHRRILIAFDGTHETHLAIEEVVALARAFNGHVRVIWAIGSPTVPGSREIYNVDELCKEAHRAASTSLVELQRQFDTDGTPAGTGVLMPDTADDGIGSALEHEAER